MPTANVNFLAHLWLADQLQADLVGAVLGDVVRGRLEGRYPPALERSIALHRRIDALTDTHPLVLEVRAGFPPGARRYAGIILDVLYDHAMALDWPNYSREALPGFTERVAQAVAAGGAWFAASGALPPDAVRLAALLRSYGTTEGVERSLDRIGRRLRPTSGWRLAVAHWSAYAPAARATAPRLMAEVLAALRRTG